MMVRRSQASGSLIVIVMQESSSNRVTIGGEEDPFEIQQVLQFIYTGGGDFFGASKLLFELNFSDVDAPGYGFLKWANLFRLGDFFQVKSLCILAAARIKQSVNRKEGWTNPENLEDFRQAAILAFASTSDANPGLRRALAEIAALNLPSLIICRTFFDCLQESAPGFAAHILLYLGGRAMENDMCACCHIDINAVKRNHCVQLCVYCDEECRADLCEDDSPD